jgi:hypothetical protein
MNVGITSQIPQLCGAIKTVHNTTHEQKITHEQRRLIN